MKPFEIKHLDLSAYEILERIEPKGGSRPRLLLRHRKNNQKFLLKTYSHNPREVWSELLASRLGMLIDVDIQTVSIKKVDGMKDDFFPARDAPIDWVPVAALVSYAFPVDFDITYGNDAPLMGSNAERFTLADIEKKIRAFEYAPDELLQRFADMIIFDAWIGNMDRHHGNWGILQPRRSQLLFLHPKFRSNKYKAHFATLFDHGSTLLFELPDAQVGVYRVQAKRFEASYLFGKSYSFFLSESGGKKNIFELIASAMRKDKDWRKRFKKSIEKLTPIREIDIAKILLQMPNCDDAPYTPDRRDLLLFSLSRRRQLLLELHHDYASLYPDVPDTE